MSQAAFPDKPRTRRLYAAMVITSCNAAMVVAPLTPISLRAAAGGSLLFRQLFDAQTGTFTYLLGDVSSRQAVIVDSVFERHGRDLALLRELGLELVASLDTHAHADHVTGSWLLHEATGCAIGLAAAARAKNVTMPLQHGDRLSFGVRWLEVRSTPGHTNGCLSFVLDDQSMAFSGDALLVRGCGRCDFQQGNPHTLWASITQQLFSLPDSCLLYPGHDYEGRAVSSVVEEKAFNARLGGMATERDFVGHMESMQLPHPTGSPKPCLATCALASPWIRASPALLQTHVGRHCNAAMRACPNFPAWVASHRDGLTLLDVRSAEEYGGPDGRVADSLLIPLPELEGRISELPVNQPVVVVCHSGSRSALATQQLLKAGLSQVANLHGGLARWADEGYPLQGVAST